MATVESSNFTAAMEKKILDLGTSEKELMEISEKVFRQGGSEEDQFKLQRAFNNRSNRAAAWSNILRALSDAQRAIIQNLRA